MPITFNISLHSHLIGSLIFFLGLASVWCVDDLLKAHRGNRYKMYNNGQSLSKRLKTVNQNPGNKRDSLLVADNSRNQENSCRKLWFRK